MNGFRDIKAQKWGGFIQIQCDVLQLWHHVPDPNGLFWEEQVSVNIMYKICDGILFHFPKMKFWNTPVFVYGGLCVLILTPRKTNVLKREGLNFTQHCLYATWNKMWKMVPYTWLVTEILKLQMDKIHCNVISVLYFQGVTTDRNYIYSFFFSFLASRYLIFCVRVCNGALSHSQIEFFMLFWRFIFFSYEKSNLIFL